MASLAADFGIELWTRLHVDASAALGILERRGVGRVRHLDVGALWLQEQHLREVIEFVKVSGTANPADLMTKHLSRDLIDQYMVHMGVALREGRAVATAQLHSAHAEDATDRQRRPHEEAAAKPQGASLQHTSRKCGWKLVGNDKVIGFFRGARAHRAPENLGICWNQITRRVTADAETGQVLEDLHPRQDGVPRDHGLRRLEHVTDLEVAIEYDHDTSNREMWHSLVSNSRWADDDEEDDATARGSLRMLRVKDRRVTDNRNGLRLNFSERMVH